MSDYYRKKPVEIRAWQFDSRDKGTPDWLKCRYACGDLYYQGGEPPYITIETLEGSMRANVGDWIIEGVKGELYPCKNEIFEATYEKVEE